MMQHTFIPLEVFDKEIEQNEKTLEKADMLQLFAAAPPPISYDLTTYCTFCYNQGPIGMCVPCTICAAIRITDPKSTFFPSPLQLYINVLKATNRGMLQDIGSDAMDVCGVLQRLGVCSEAAMVGKVFPSEPSPESMAEAALHKYSGFQNITPKDNFFNAIKASIFAMTPVAISFWVPTSFDRIKQDGIMPLPKNNEERKGGHTCLILKYNSSHVTILNSWGDQWGKRGYFKMPIEFFNSTYHGYRYVRQLVVLRSIKP